VVPGRTAQHHKASGRVRAAAAPAALVCMPDSICRGLALGKTVYFVVESGLYRGEADGGHLGKGIDVTLTKAETLGVSVPVATVVVCSLAHSWRRTAGMASRRRRWRT